MTQTIEQLQARVAELEVETARLTTKAKKLRNDLKTWQERAWSEKHKLIESQVAHAAAVLHANQLQDALVEIIECRENLSHLDKPTEFAISQARNFVISDMRCIARRALATQISTEALDKYVAEKVKEAKQTAVSEFLEKTGKYVTNDASRGAAIEAATTSLNEEIRILKDAVDNLADGELKARKQIATLTRQRDLAVKALDKLARLGNGDRYGTSNGNVIAQQALSTIKESEGK